MSKKLSSVTIGGKIFPAINSGERLSKGSGTPFIVSGRNSATPGAVVTNFSQFSFQLFSKALLTGIYISVDAVTAAGANVAVPVILAALTQPDVSNPVAWVVGTPSADMNFSSAQGYINWQPRNEYFVSSNSTMAINITSNFNAALGATDIVRTSLVVCFESF